MVVFESDYLQALYEDRRSEFLLITFATATMRANGRRFFCSNLADKAGISVLGFVATRPNWYPAAAMDAAIAAVSPILERYDERVCIGYSMGGFATIKYARKLRSTVSIAICPQFSVDPSDIPPAFEKALKDTMAALKVNTADLDPNMRITADSDHGLIYALYDNRDAAELAHVARIGGVVKLHHIVMPYTKHDTHRCFAEADIVTRLISICQAGDTRAVQRFANQRRKVVSARAFNLGMELAERHPRWARELLRRYSASFELRELGTLSNRLAEIAIESGNYAWAVCALEKVLIRLNSHVPSRKLLANAYLMLNDMAGAVRTLRSLASLTPDDPGVRDKLVLALLRAADLQAARDEAEDALHRFPAHAGLLHRASEVAQRQGDAEDAAGFARRALNADPHSRPRMERLAYLLMEADRLQEAEAQFLEILAIDPFHAGAQRGLRSVQAQGRRVPVVQLMRRMPAAAMT